MKLTIMLSFAILATLALGTADADWDRRGWTKLGEQTVNGRTDRDTIRVGAREGKFTKLNIVVERSDLELLSFVVTFSNGQKWEPRLRHHFREGSRTRVIDLPGSERIIQKIDVTYRNTPGGGNARMEVWGFRTGDVGRGRRDDNRPNRRY